MQRLAKSRTEFAVQTHNELMKMSPLSLAVVFESIKRGANMSLSEVYKMEFAMGQGFLKHREFFEGIRALLVDKDQ